MTLEEAINASQFDEAMAKCNGLWCKVSDNQDDEGSWGVSIGVERMPTHDYQQVPTLEAAIEVVKEKGWLDEDWQPVGDDD